MAYEFKIGLFAGGVAGMVDIFTLGLPAPQQEYRKGADSISLGDNSERLIGSPIAGWHWAFQQSAARTALRVYCPNGISNKVYIRTLDDTNNYKNYLCTLVWPISEPRVAGRVLDFTLEFRNMKIQPEEEP